MCVCASISLLTSIATRSPKITEIKKKYIFFKLTSLNQIIRSILMYMLKTWLKMFHIFSTFGNNARGLMADNHWGFNNKVANSPIRPIMNIRATNAYAGHSKQHLYCMYKLLITNTYNMHERIKNN